MYCTRCGKYIVDEEKGCPCTWSDVTETKREEKQDTEATMLEQEKKDEAKVTGLEQEKKDEAKGAGSEQVATTQSQGTEQNTRQARNLAVNEIQQSLEPTKTTIEKPLSNAVKVAIVAITCVIPFVGLVFGFILSSIFLASQKQDEKSFGKALLILCIFFIAIALLCCIFVYAFHIFDFLEGYLEAIS